MTKAEPIEQVSKRATEALPTRRFARSEQELTSIGFGTAPIGLTGYQDPEFNQADSEKQSLDALAAAFDHGITFFDTAPAYANKTPKDGWSTDRASERLLGKALRGRDRDRLFLASKNMFDRMDAGGIRSSCEATLRLLGVEYLDLFQVHGIIKKPFRADNWRDFVTDEVLETFARLKDEGKVRFVGITGYREGALSAAIESGLFDAVMPQFNYFYRGAEWELVRLAEQNGVSVLPMRPLTGAIIKQEIGPVAPELAERLYKAAIRYLLKFSSVTSLPIGMRTAWEVETNCRLVREVEAELADEAAETRAWG